MPGCYGFAVKKHATITTDEFRTLNRCLDEAIADAVTAFGDERENELLDQATHLHTRLGALAEEQRRLVDIRRVTRRTMRRMAKTPSGESVQGGQVPIEPPRPLRIVIADDDRDAVLTLMMVLRHEGHDVRGVYKGIDVLRLLEEFEPDAVILDIYMPELNGYDVARGIASKRRHMPLMIGVSGVYKKGSDRILAELTGFDHYLTKPYDPSDVLRLLAPLRIPSPPA